MKTGPSINRHRSKQDYETPWEFIRAVEKRFGKLGWDLAATKDNSKAPNFVGVAVDSLLVCWWELWREYGLLWLNPPYDCIPDWASKCVEESDKGAKILFLVPASVDSNWWANYVHHVCPVLFLNPRLKFDGTKPNPKTGKIDPYPKPLALCCYGFKFGCEPMELQNWYEPWRWK